MSDRRAFMREAAQRLLAIAGAAATGSAIGSAMYGCERGSGGDEARRDVAAGDSRGGGSKGDRSMRVAAVSPALAITLRDLGLADRIVARHAWDMVLDLKVPIVGDQSAVDFEALLAADPTHVMLEWGVRPVPERLAEMATRHDWRVKSWSLLSYQQVRASFGEIAAFLADGAPGDGQEIIARATELTARLDAACAQRPAATRAGTVLLLHSVMPPAALGPGSFHHEILERLGGRSALTSGGAYMQMHMEDLVRIAPESIVIVEPRDARGDAAKGTSDWPSMERKLGAIARLQIPAVKERRVALIDDPLCLTPSSAMIGFAAELAGVLERWGTARQG